MAVMTAERTYAPLGTRGDDALQLVDSYKAAVNEQVRVEELRHEFPYYAQAIGAEGVWLAHFEDNDTGAFKWRGALVGASTLARQGAQHLIVPSAGNHARGAVWAARQLDMAVTAVVPASAPPKKQQMLRELWDSPKLQVEVVGQTFDESLAYAKARQDGVLLHPYGEEVTPGQGTIVDDVLRQVPDVKTLVVPLGGGGLVAGILQRLDEHMRSDVLVVAAQAEGSDSMSNSLESGYLADATNPNKRFGGSAVQRVGEAAFEYCRYSPNLVVTTVPNADVDELVYWYASGRHEFMRTEMPNLEPTSLVAVAALRQNVHRGKTVVIGTGQNESL